jgi:hypothetical protein
MWYKIKYSDLNLKEVVIYDPLDKLGARMGVDPENGYKNLLANFAFIAEIKHSEIKTVSKKRFLDEYAREVAGCVTKAFIRGYNHHVLKLVDKSKH